MMRFEIASAVLCGRGVFGCLGFCVCFFLRFFRIPFCVHAAHDEVQHNAADDGQDRPELRRRQNAEELAAVIATQKLNQKAEYTVGNHIKTHVVPVVVAQQKHRADSEHDKQECRLVQLGRVNGVGKIGELDGKEEIRLFAVAAAGKEAADPPESVRNQDTARNQ